jgi:hypothetical protein
MSTRIGDGVGVGPGVGPGCAGVLAGGVGEPQLKVARKSVATANLVIG